MIKYKTYIQPTNWVSESFRYCEYDGKVTFIRPYLMALFPELKINKGLISCSVYYLFPLITFKDNFANNVMLKYYSIKAQSLYSLKHKNIHRSPRKPFS